ncbi:hypothetical protein THAOC_12358, partial [Thalassiosira oceanica]
TPRHNWGKLAGSHRWVSGLGHTAAQVGKLGQTGLVGWGTPRHKWGKLGQTCGVGSCSWLIVSLVRPSRPSPSSSSLLLVVASLLVVVVSVGGGGSGGKGGGRLVHDPLNENPAVQVGVVGFTR